MRMKIRAAAALALAVGACSSDSGNPMDREDVQAAGTYAATFATGTVSEGCQGFVPTGSTEGTVTVTESAGTATLRLTDLTDLIRNDPQGTFDAETGAFAFTGPITVGDEETQIQAQGTIQGTFTEAGSMNLTFDFTAFTCMVTGTIVGQRTG